MATRKRKSPTINMRGGGVDCNTSIAYGYPITYKTYQSLSKLGFIDHDDVIIDPYIRYKNNDWVFVVCDEKRLSWTRVGLSIANLDEFYVLSEKGKRFAKSLPKEITKGEPPELYVITWFS